jgi:hypothetical protein
MFKTKNILIAVIVIVVIGIGLYFVLTSVPKTKTPPVEEVPPAAPYGEKEFQGMKYEIIGIGSSRAQGIHRVVYDIITGKLTEELAGTLAEKIIGDITAEDPSIEEITLLFYSDIISAGVGKYDVAHVIWVPNEITVRMIEE